MNREKKLALLAAIAGAGLMVVGVGMVWLPAAFVLGGASMLGVALLFDPDRRVRR